MAAARNSRRKTRSEGAPGWAWLVVGLLVGLFVAFLMGLQGERGTDDRDRSTVRSSAVSEPEADEPGRPRFDFYSILPEMEVPVPAPDVEEEVRRERDRREREREAVPEKQEIEPGTAYALQVGSFRREEEAERYRAELTLMGLEPHIQTVTIDETEWYRVRVGPILDLEELDMVRRRLDENAIDAILLKLREQG